MKLNLYETIGELAQEHGVDQVVGALGGFCLTKLIEAERTNAGSQEEEHWDRRMRVLCSLVGTP